MSRRNTLTEKARRRKERELKVPIVNGKLDEETGNIVSHLGSQVKHETLPESNFAAKNGEFISFLQDSGFKQNPMTRSEARRTVRSRSRTGGKHPFGKTTSSLSRWGTDRSRVAREAAMPEHVPPPTPSGPIKSDRKERQLIDRQLTMQQRQR